MRGSWFRVLLAVSTALVLGAGAAHATPLASAYVGNGGPVPALGCTSSRIGGDLDTTGTYFVNVELASHQNCGYYHFFTVVVTSHLPWQLFATNQSGTVTTYTVSGIAATVTGPGCRMTVAGTAGASYDSATSVLTVVTQSTVVTYVDPSNNCLGLTMPGQSLPILSSSYAVVLY
jgi:hypothetical protein